MPQRKARGRRPQRGRARANVQGAIRSGRAQAADVLAFRDKQIRRRAAVTRGLERKGRAAAAPPRSAALERTRRFLGSRATAGVLIAEGDSWFDYPLNDVLRLLEDDYGYDVESVAHKGDCVEDMAYSA